MSRDLASRRVEEGGLLEGEDDDPGYRTVFTLTEEGWRWVMEQLESDEVPPPPPALVRLMRDRAGQTAHRK